MLLAVPVLSLMVHLPVTVLPVRGEVAFWVTRVAFAGAVPVAKQIIEALLVIEKIPPSKPVTAS